MKINKIIIGKDAKDKLKNCINKEDTVCFNTTDAEQRVIANMDVCNIKEAPRKFTSVAEIQALYIKVKNTDDSTDKYNFFCKYILDLSEEVIVTTEDLKIMVKDILLQFGSENQLSILLDLANVSQDDRTNYDFVFHRIYELLYKYEWIEVDNNKIDEYKMFQKHSELDKVIDWLNS